MLHQINPKLSTHPPKTYPCKRCDETFVSKSAKISHSIRVHQTKTHLTQGNIVMIAYKSTSGHLWPCPVCGKAYSIPGYLQTHFATKHTVAEIENTASQYNSSDGKKTSCSLDAKSRSSRTQSLEKQSPAPELLECDICCFRLGSKFAKEAHDFIHHEGPRPVDIIPEPFHQTSSPQSRT